MFRKVLIANRGEIAVRIGRACRELGIHTVAVYSDADRDSLHVRYADEAYRIGPPPSAESYLDVDALMEVARQAGVEAVHPGYGFLAENAGFARRVESEGFVFIGPSADAMALMGDKTAARRAAKQAGVPVVPGSEATPNAEQAARKADAVGYPLLVKAAAGGGGKGMRFVGEPRELRAALAEARSEAAASFGDGTVYLERYLDRPRHVEIQILGDQHDSLVHLGERECSIQRRHQKLIEESPSPIMPERDDDLRSRMGAAAVAVARAGGYHNLGTVEFLVTPDRSFYFLEMNTRLQVEHPVTEMVTGVDLVKLQLAIAAGEPLPFRQEDVTARGWAMELRLTAEDPYLNFLPASGRLTVVRPAGGPGVRDDSGIFTGWQVTPHYDPLLAKLIVWGETRESCLIRARRAVREYRIGGIPTTLPFHDHMLHDAGFVAGEIDVGYVERRWADIVEAETRGAVSLGKPTKPGKTDEGERPARAAIVAAAAAAYEKGSAGSEARIARGTRSPWGEAALREQLGVDR